MGVLDLLCLPGSSAGIMPRAGLHDGLADGLELASLQTCKHRIVLSPITPEVLVPLSYVAAKRPRQHGGRSDSCSQMDTAPLSPGSLPADLRGHFPRLFVL